MLEKMVDLAGLIKYIIKKYNQQKIKHAFAEEIEYELKAVEDAHNELLIDFYTIIGASIFGILYPPNNPEQAIDKISSKVEKSIRNAEKSFVQLIETMKVHQEDFFKIFENDHTTKFIVRDLIHSTNFETRTIDWSYLSTKKHFIHLDFSNATNNSFPKKLHESLIPLMEDIKINEVIWNKDSVRNIDGICKNEELQTEIVSLMNKIKK